MKREKKEEGERTHLVSVFPPPQVFISFLFVSCFFSLLFFFFFFCTHCDTSLESGDSPQGWGVRGHFAWRIFTYKKAVHTYFAFTTAKKKKK